MKTQYVGTRGRGGPEVLKVCEDSRSWDLNPRLDLRNHSPTGLEWGYCGSGPAQLALALLADALDDQTALALYQDFKFAVIAGLPYEGWTITREQIKAAVEKIQAGEWEIGATL